ncbi:hypothetical protein CEUSTIGMA_g13068.t1 [Chlamydomonas eustigma]|uniref:Pre-mRNA-splicing factor 18 n=1 Tax=Chlamydomonas eustigma TaxID=1157962 RepID=A0A250XRL4_9CHLO|nr:hypothetical protein CEUSTIGMA_g13068.t1 [Chlamydomonas eustigma]|eukprot:GAX85653.1 hypothetical protein CEUSTIGMA_g13068.t1 [Chlamydomonas eustigma]
MSLDALKAMKEKLKKEKEEAGQGKKYITKAELEAAKLKRIRDEEAMEKEKKKKTGHEEAQDHGSKKSHTADAINLEQASTSALPLHLPKQQVIRRLRGLGQPATLFGESDSDRLQRLLKTEKEMAVEAMEDDVIGGQQGNLLLELQREGGGARGGGGRGGAGGVSAAASKDSGSAAGAGGGNKTVMGGNGRSVEMAASGEEMRQGEDGGMVVAVSETEDPVMSAFKKAAAMLKERREEEGMCVEDRIEKWIRKWTREWEEDLDRRPLEVLNSGSGHQTSLMFRQTMKYFEPLYDRLKHRGLHVELRAGLWMMVSAMKERNYLQANDIYLKLAIGNSAWPIGVTQVGIHERSAREKISHVMNESGIAHIMNDEATRKYFQAMKRLITFVQRVYPTDPSRSVNFQTGSDLGRGIIGGGSDKLALLEAEAKGEDWKNLGLEQAPHFLEKDGSIQVPTKWRYMLQRAKDKITDEEP